MKTLLTKVLPTLAVLLLGGFIAWALVKSRPTPEIAPKKADGTLVEVMEAQPQRQFVRVEAMGTVIPSRELTLTPEVSGRIIEMNPNLVPGGILKAGEVVALIDTRDYEVAVMQAKAALEDARLYLDLEYGRQVVAKREWDVVYPSTQSSEASSRLALREPQLESAKANVEAAKSALSRAELNLDRTIITAPFNATVRTESVEVGQLVTQQTPLANLAGADQYWVQVSIPVNRLPWIEMPGKEGEGGAVAKVIHQIGPDSRIEREGRVVRLLGDLDPAGRMARVLVAVDDPLGIESQKNRPTLPLLIGAYVTVEIDGREIDNVYVIPRTAIREGDRVWVMDEKDRLSVRDVDIIWRRKDDVFVTNAIQPGELIVTSRIATPIPGMQLRTNGAESGDQQTGKSNSTQIGAETNEKRIDGNG